MYHYENYQPAPKANWGSDPLVITAQATPNIYDKKLKPKLWIIIGAVLGIVVLIAAVIGMISLNGRDSTTQWQSPPELSKKLPPELAEHISYCYSSDAFLQVFQMSGEVPACLVDNTPENMQTITIYFLDSAEQVSAVTDSTGYGESRDLSSQAATGETLLMHIYSENIFYVVNVMAPDQAYVFSMSRVSESEVMAQLERFGIITATSVTQHATET